MYDAVQVLAKAMDELGTVEGFTVDPVSCGQDRPWRDGQKIIKYIKRVRDFMSIFSDCYVKTFFSTEQRKNGSFCTTSKPPFIRVDRCDRKEEK